MDGWMGGWVCWTRMEISLSESQGFGRMWAGNTIASTDSQYTSSLDTYTHTASTERHGLLVEHTAAAAVPAHTHTRAPRQRERTKSTPPPPPATAPQSSPRVGVVSSTSFSRSRHTPCPRRQRKGELAPTAGVPLSTFCLRPQLLSAVSKPNTAHAPSSISCWHPVPMAARVKGRMWPVESGSAGLAFSFFLSLSLLSVARIPAICVWEITTFELPSAGKTWYLTPVCVSAIHSIDSSVELTVHNALLSLMLSGNPQTKEKKRII